MKKGPKDKSPAESFEGTRVDLGEDLLERTGTTVPGSASDSSESTAREQNPATQSAHLEDQFQSAKILISEGLTEEAKKVLRGILIADPRHILARNALDEVHELELKQIFGEDRRKRSFRAGPEPVLSDLDAEEIMRELDRDLKLGIFGEESAVPNGTDGVANLSLFQDPQALQTYADRLDQTLTDLTGRDRVDLGVAFLVMGLHELAMRQFKAATHVFMQHPDENIEAILGATGLTAYALILVGRPYEATMMIQATLRDSEIKHESKLDFLYLMGRAYEAMRKPDLAVRWYNEVRKIDSKYRDVEARLRAKPVR